MKKKICLLVCVAIFSGLFVTFQNFTSKIYLTEKVKINSYSSLSIKFTNLHKTPLFLHADDMDLWRRRVWGNGSCTSKEWEVCFEGMGIPGWNQRSHLDWDNAIDDDWDEPLGNSKSWIVNLERKNGFMEVNRTLEGKTRSSGHFWRRDEFLTTEAGFEAQFEVKVYPDSQSSGVKFHYFNEKHQFKFVFSPDEIQFHSLIGNESRSLEKVKLNNTEFSLYKIRYESGGVSLWKNEILLFSNLKPGYSNFIEKGEGKLGHIAPRIGFGDNNNYVENHQGHYGISFFRYKRANNLIRRSPPALPPREECNSNIEWTNISTVFEIKKRLISWDSLKSTLPIPPFNQMGKTIEFMAKVDFSKTSALSLDFGDHLGGIILSIKRNRIEMKANTKPGLSAIVELNTEGINKYRLVRSNLGLYWYLYLNDEPLPVLLDVRASGSSLSEPGSFGNIPRQVIHVGSFETPSLLDFSKGEAISPRKNTIIKDAIDNLAIIEKLRFVDKAIGANLCN